MEKYFGSIAGHDKSIRIGPIHSETKDEDYKYINIYDIKSHKRLNIMIKTTDTNQGFYSNDLLELSRQLELIRECL